MSTLIDHWVLPPGCEHSPIAYMLVAAIRLLNRHCSQRGFRFSAVALLPATGAMLIYRNRWVMASVNPFFR